MEVPDQLIETKTKYPSLAHKNRFDDMTMKMEDILVKLRIYVMADDPKTYFDVKFHNIFKL